MTASRFHASFLKYWIIPPVLHIAQASLSIYISVPVSDQCSDILKTIPTLISTETDKLKPNSISDYQLLNIDTKGYITANTSSILSIPEGFPNDNTLSNNHSLNLNLPII
jgi:hypothetical protein